MSFLRRVVTAERLLSSHDRPLIRLSLLQQNSSLSSSSSTSTTNPQQQRSTPKTPKAQLPKRSPPPPSSSYSDVVDEKSVHRPRPRPSEIPWQAKVANAVNLIGVVKIPVQFQTSPDGNCWAGTIIAQEDTTSSTSSPPSFWIPVIFEGDLAHIARCHLKEKDCVYIAGHLSVDAPVFTLSEGQANVQVIVHSMNFVQGSPKSKRSSLLRKTEKHATDSSASLKEDISVHESLKGQIADLHESGFISLPKKNHMDAAIEPKDNDGLLSTPEQFTEKVEYSKVARKTANMTKDGNPTLAWRDLLNDPKQWWDHRENKKIGVVKANHPDFVHKDSRLPLWLNSAPEWVLSGLGRLEFDVPPSKMKQGQGQKDDDSWKNLVKNPGKWWDNRGHKVNAKGPDFKNKDTGKGLWLDGAPAWALSSLPPLKDMTSDATDNRKAWASKAM